MTIDVLTAPDGDHLTIAADRALLKRRSVRGAGATLCAQGVRFVLQFAGQIVLAHWLAPRAFGLVAMVGPVMGLVQIFNDLGLTQATVQRPDISHPELSALFWINMAISLVLACLLVAAAPAIAWFYHEPRLTMIVIACASLLVLSGAGAQQIALLNRRMRFVALAVIDISCAAAALVAGLLAAWYGLGVWSLVVMQAANSFTIMALSWVLSDWVPGRFRRGQDVAGLLRFGGHVTGFNLLAFAENSLGPVLIGRLAGAAALGFYDRGYKLVIVPWAQISLPVARVAVSLLSRLASTHRDYEAAWRRMFQGLVLVTAPGMLWAAMTADTLTPTILGPAWHAAAPIVSDLSLATMLVPLGASAYWLFVSQGRVREQLQFGMASGAALVASSIIGVHWGALGVARCYLLFAPFVQGLHFWAATRSGPVQGAAAWRAAWPLVLGLLASAACVAAATLGLAAVGAPVLVCLPVLLAVSYGVCGLALASFPAGLGVVRDVWELRGMIA